MLRFQEFHRGPHGVTRRDILRVGGLGVAGLALTDLLGGQGQAAPEAALDRTFGRAKNILFLFLSGGPSQYETFDPKPDAPAEIRGIFKPIATNVPGVRICELLPRTARIADKLCIVRSMYTGDPNHESNGYWINTGQMYRGPNMRALHPTDWPTFSSIVKMLKPSRTVPFTSAVLPEPIIANPGIFLPGQNGGFLGTRWDPEYFRCDPSASDFTIEGFTLPPDVSPVRLSDRRTLVQQIDQQARLVEQHGNVQEQDRTIREALSVVLSSKAREAFRLDKESSSLRDRYGRTKWGQSLLLGRRLLEAGVRMVFVNWPREPGDISSSNPLWDTHAQNNTRMKDVLCPQFDVGFPTLIEDLDQRGMLAETLVVAIGEMGRTPTFNAAGGRDHWGNVWSFVLAGAGIRTAQVVGASDKKGAEVHEGKVTPADLTATMAHLLGIGHHAMFPDKFNRPYKVTEGEPIRAALGLEPATRDRTTPGGVIAPAAVVSNELLVHTGFEPPAVLNPPDRPVRGWQAFPIAKEDGFGVLLGRVPGPRSRGGEHHVGIGYGLQTGNGTGKIAQGTRAVLCQEVFNPRPGKYTFTIHASGGAYDRPDYYRDVWLKHFTCRIVLFGYTDSARDPRKIVEFASEKFTPPFAGPYEADYRKYTVTAVLRDQDGGGQIRNGVGVAIVVEKTSPGELDVPAGGPRSQGLIRLDDVSLDFLA
jgi:Protein of unknown function (DUF1501)